MNNQSICEKCGHSGLMDENGVCRGPVSEISAKPFCCCKCVFPVDSGAEVEAQIDFSCRVCGVQCAIAPDPPARAVCPEHCEDHDYVHDQSRAGRFCQHCDEEQPLDWR